MNYEINDDFAQLVQQRYAMPLYQSFWGVETDDITEVDQKNRGGDELAGLLDRGGVDKIVKLGTTLMVAQRIRRPRPKKYRDLTIRRQLEQDWDAEYSKLKESYMGNGTTPSKYAYGEVTQKAESEIESLLENVKSFRDVNCSNITTPMDEAIRSFYIFDLEGFLKREFAGDLAKKKSPDHHDRTNDQYYWQNKSERDNGFYSWDWNVLRMEGLVEAEFQDGVLVKRGDNNYTNKPTRPDKPHDITKWADAND